MAIVELQDLQNTLKRNERLIGIDLGSKTIGLAISDVLRSVASPVETLVKGKFTKDAQKIQDLIDTEQFGGIVLGLPKEMDGTEGKRCQITRAFAYNLAGAIDLPILLWDERLSTVAVERILINEADLTRKRRKEVVDRAAAAYILQGALDALNHQV